MSTRSTVSAAILAGAVATAARSSLHKPGAACRSAGDHDGRIGDFQSLARAGGLTLSGAFDCRPRGDELQAPAFAGDPRREEGGRLLRGSCRKLYGGGRAAARNSGPPPPRPFRLPPPRMPV